MNKFLLRGDVLKRVFGAAVLAFASISAAHAAVITFEGNTGTAFNQDFFQQAGYTVSFVDPASGSNPIGRFIDGSNPSSCGTSICPTNNPTTYFDLFNTGFIDITANSGASFSFSGLDASFIATAAGQFPQFPAALQVFGFRADGSSDVIQFNIPNTIAFQTFDATDVENGALFAQQQYVELAIVGFSCNAAGQCTGLDNSPGEVGVDNIRLSDLPVNNVPEPGTAALLAFGLLGMGMRARRRV